MEILTTHTQDLEFSCVPDKYMSKVDGQKYIGPVGLIGYTGPYVKRNPIPNTMCFMIKVKNKQNTKLISEIYRVILPLIGDDCLINPFGSPGYSEYTDEYNTARLKYQKIVENSDSVYTESEFEKTMRGRFNPGLQISSIYIHCRKGTNIYTQLLKLQLLSKDEYDY